MLAFRGARAMSFADYCFVYVTVANVEEAKKIGRALVERKLCACANVLPGITSIYEWQGKLSEESETVLILKTRRQLFAEVEGGVRQLSSYECPCIVALPLVEGFSKYLDWLGMQTERNQTQRD
jgi:periplasmic divalent cation tolerance protein